MMRWILATAALSLVATPLTQAQTITIKDADLTNGTHNWTKNNTYLLDGFVYLEAGGVLTIEAGTIVKGKATPTTGDNASALIITRGATINANGTAGEPIIFTAEVDDVSNSSDLDETDNGLWGGLILLGYANLGFNVDSAFIEGIPSGEDRAAYGPGAKPPASPDDDNSGSLKYVSIRHGGAELAPGDEINGLTLGGVGGNTTLEHIEVYANQDDGIEFFGGKAKIKWASVTFCGDDGYDWDLGWRGYGQFWFMLQRSDDGDSGGEHDGAKPDAQLPFSDPMVYNATFIGAGSGGTAKNSFAVLMRDGTGGTYANSIFTQFANHALEVEDLPAASGVDSYQRLEDGDLSFLCNIWFDFGHGNELSCDTTTGILNPSAGAEDSTCASLVSHLTNNSNVLIDPQIMAVSRVTSAGTLDPRPNMAGPAGTTTCNAPADPFFTPATYRGAFSSDASWLLGWTALSEYGHLSTALSVDETSGDGYEIGTPSPNPANGFATVHVEMPAAEYITISVVDLGGRLVKTLGTKSLSSGTNYLGIDLENLEAGLYLVEVQTKHRTISTKLIVN